MSADPVRAFLDSVHGLLPPAQHDEASALARRTADPKALAGELVKRGRLTLFQAKKALQGRAPDLRLGPYVLIDVLGEGGMGQVFKARHTVMNRIVALKVIRPERFADPGAVARFRREIEVVAKLSHPNVIHAYDAAQEGDIHYFVMEYIEGADLARTLKDRGPLPVPEACDYVRQAALGLQHAHEAGLIHRDIKPANLLVCLKPAGQVKVLDLGLARATALDGVTDLTPEGSVMGTPDYLAPEQANDARGVDIRADIYSLGCTLYHLLTGRVPFPGGTLAQKLQWHQQDEPAAVESVRRDVPPELAAVVRRMMAKKPAERFATPAEAAAALAPFCPGAPGTPPPTALPTTKTHAPAPPTGPRRLWPVAGLILLLVAACVAGYWLMQGRVPGIGTPRVEVVVRLSGIARPADGKAVITLDGNPIPFDDLRQDIKLAAGTHVLEVRQGAEVIERREFEVPAGAAAQRIVVPEAGLPPGPITTLTGHQQEVSCVAYSGDGLRLVSVGPAAADGLFIWDAARGKGLHHYTGAKPPRLIRGHPSCAALSFDGHTALIGGRHSYKSAHVKPWMLSVGVESGTRFWESADHSRRILSVALSSDGKMALSADEAGVTRGWDAAKGRQLFQLEGSLAAFSPTADRVVTARQKKAKLWLLGEAPRELREFEGHDDAIRAIALAPDGRHVLTGGDTTARLWDASTGARVQTFRGHTKEVTGVAFSPDGRRVLSGSRDGTVRLWNVADAKELHRFTQHTDAVLSVAYSPGGRRAASGGLDRTVRLWSLPP